MKRKQTTKKTPRKLSRAARADRHNLYERAVQNSDAEYDFIDATYRKIRGRRAELMREDFCGTANMCCEWVRRRRTNRAIGVDLDTEVLDWGRQHNLAKLPPSAAKRLTLVQGNVLSTPTEPADILMAMNFSYWIFKDRKSLRRYFRKARGGLAKDGIMFLDAFGGSEAYVEQRDRTKYRGFTYVWDQAKFNPITGDFLCHIHFSFPDGSRMKEVFTYDWRLWTVPEIREVLLEAGFSRVTVYWEEEDKDGEPTDVYLPTTEGINDPAWVCFIAAEK